MNLTWETPPNNRAPRMDWKTIAEALKSRPNEWAVVLDGTPSPSQAMTIKQGRAIPFQPAGSFQARAIKADGLYRIFARFVGASDE